MKKALLMMATAALGVASLNAGALERKGEMIGAGFAPERMEAPVARELDRRPGVLNVKDGFKARDKHGQSYMVFPIPATERTVRVDRFDD